MDTLLQDVRQTIQDCQMVHRGETLLLAVSGGADSVALLHILEKLRNSLHVQLVVAHLNHGMRPDAADDALFVEGLARRMNLPYVCDAVDVPAYQRQHRLSPEDAARRLRYAYLSAAAARQGADRIAVAHTADDQAETILMRLLRGAGLRGLAGIPPKRGRIIRPLIRIQRRRILALLRECHLPFREDPSNQERHYLRNRLRLDLLPHLRQGYNPRLTEALCTTADLLAEDEAMLQALTQERLRAARLPGQPGQVRLRVETLVHQPVALQRRMLRQALGEVCGHLHGITAKHIAAIIDLLRMDSGSRRVSLPRCLVVERRYGVLLIQQRHLPWPSLDDPVAAEEAVPIPGQCVLEALGMTVVSDLLGRAPVAPGVEPFPSGDEVWLDAAAVGPDVRLRTRRQGDRFQPLGSPHTQKLKDFLVNAKVPRVDRDSLPLVVTRRGIAWVVGVRIADWAKVTPATRHILRLRIVRHAATDTGLNTAMGQRSSDFPVVFQRGLC